MGSLEGLLPVIVAGVIALFPAPEAGQHAWYFFAIFAGVIVADAGAAAGRGVGLIAWCWALLAPYVLFSPAELAKAVPSPPTPA